MKFAIYQGCKDDHESATVVTYCALNPSHSCRVFGSAADVPADHVPVGTVPWVTNVLARPIVPDYYPEFLSGWLHRKVWPADKWPIGRRVFIKPADRHKRFTGFVTTGTWKGKRRGPYWCSEPVKFTCEWRYYVAAGTVIDARWGSGEVEQPKAPTLAINWPKDFYGAVDFGIMDNGQLALIESNSPFACGWYGPILDGASYVDWLAQSWTWMTSK